MKRAGDLSLLNRSDSKDQQKRSSDERWMKSKLANGQGGKSSSGGRASSLPECSHSLLLIPEVVRFPVPSVVSPSKSVHSFSNQSIATLGSSESRLGCASINWLTP
jgi:hypothetical protein